MLNGSSPGFLLPYGPYVLTFVPICSDATNDLDWEPKDRPMVPEMLFTNSVGASLICMQFR